MWRMTLGCVLLLAAAQGAEAAAAVAGRPAFDWITGHWCVGKGKGSEGIEEYWLPARAGVLMGMSRTTRGDRLVGFEFMRIDLTSDVPTFIAQPNGGAPVKFARSAGGDNWVRFENPSHDFPQRVEYRRDGEYLVAEVSGPGKGGVARAIRFEYERCGEAPAVDAFRP